MKEFIAAPKRRVLFVSPLESRRNRWAETLNTDDLQVCHASSVADAASTAMDQPLDCLIADYALPDGTVLDLIERINREPQLKGMPVIAYTDPDSARPGPLPATHSVSGLLHIASSSGQLINFASQALHRRTQNLPLPLRSVLESAQQIHSILAGRKVLVVDDDIRNIFAMTSVLERQKMVIISAETGKDAIKTIKNTPDIDVVLMDIMMPDMDGYDTTRQIRKIEKFKDLPIVAVTAKAMKGDREKCIEAGATEYLSKPVDTQQLLSLLRVLISK